MKKLLILLILVCFSKLLHSQNKDAMTSQENKFNIKSLYSLAIQEDVKSILAVLDTLPDNQLTQEEIIIKEKYFNRFKSGNENYEYETDDILLKNVIDIYRSYWTKILLKQKPVDVADNELMKELSDYMIQNHLNEISGSKQEIESDPMKYFSDLLTVRNYFNNVTGKTGNLYDIYIWKTQDTVIYDAELPESKFSVPVLFMKDIITMGWEEYATFGYAYPGGWPSGDKLFCVAKAYDVTKEKFTVSYMLHEAQHFYDMKTYEEMPSWHLEYRAKLAELSRADESLQKIISGFIRGAKNDSTLSHPFAEYLVVKNLSEVFFGNDFEKDQDKWNSLGKEDIHREAVSLLFADSKKLKLKSQSGKN